MMAIRKAIHIALFLSVTVVVILGNSTVWTPGNSQQTPFQTATVTVTSTSQTTIQPTVVTTQTVTTMQSYLPQGTMTALTFFFIAAFLVTIFLLNKAKKAKPVARQFCTSCGAELKLVSKFCSKCGAEQVQN